MASEREYPKCSYLGVVVRSRAPAERARRLAAVASEVGVEEVGHRPEVAALLDVHLEEVAEVVERGAAGAQAPLLLDRRGLGVALGDDQAAERVPVLARDLLPHRLPEVVAEADPALGYALGEEDPPAILGHADVVEVRPAARIDRHGGAQIDRVLLEALRAHLAPPGEEVRLPLLERALQALVGGQVYVVRDFLVQLHAAHGLTSSAGRARAAGRPSRRAPARLSPRSRSAARRSSSATPRGGRISWSRASPGRGNGGSPPGRSARRGSSPRAPRSPGAPPPPSRGRRGRR